MILACVEWAVDLAVELGHVSGFRLIVFAGVGCVDVHIFLFLFHRQGLIFNIISRVNK